MKMLSLRRPMRSIMTEDLQALTRSLGVDRLLESHDAHCSICNNTILDYEGISALYPAEKAVRFVCRRPECIQEFALVAARAGLT